MQSMKIFRRVLHTRHIVTLFSSLLLVGCAGIASNAKGSADAKPRVSIADFGAVGDGATLNTEKIQSAIDQVATKGGGTIVVPSGVFLSSSIFLKPGVNLHLDKNAVLKGSPNIADYPRMRTRIEGHYEAQFIPGLINADKCNNLRITGPGTIDGSGEPYWKEFWRRYNADNTTKNLDVLRPRLAIIENSDSVQISGVTFKHSGYWNLHLYRCTNVLVENTRFQVPDDQKCPSTDGIDVDSCQRVTIRGCTFRVDDDCIAMKGSKGPLAMQDKDSPPVEHVRIENCTFERGHGAVTLGSEATVVRDVVVENCRVIGAMSIARLKLRPDTPQHYEDIHYRNITLDSTGGGLLVVRPWTQYFDLKGQSPPKSIVRNVTLTNIKGSFGAFGETTGNPGQSEISDITLKNIDVQFKDATLKNSNTTKGLKIENVTINGKPFSR